MQGRLARAVAWAPAAAAVVYFLTIVVNQGRIRTSLDAHADFASAPVLAELFPKAPPGSIMVLGDYPWYEAFWLLRATSWLPNHELVWQLVPFALWLGTALLAGVAARAMVDSRWAGVTAASLVICGGVAVRLTLWSLNTHGPAAFHVALLGAALVLAAAAPGRGRGPLAWVVAVVVGVVTGVGATDSLVVAGGIGPFVLGALALGVLRGRRRLVAQAAVVVGVALVGAAILDELAQNAKITWTNKAIVVVALDQVMEHVELLPGMAARLASINPFGEELDLSIAVAMLAMFTTIAAAFVVVRGSARHVHVAVFERSSEGAGERVATTEADDADVRPTPGTARADATSLSGRDDAFLAGVVFWPAVVVILVLAIVFTSAAFDVWGARYLVSAWVAVAVLIPALAVRADVRWVGALTATVLAVASTYAFVRAPDPNLESDLPSKPLAESIQAFAKANGATRGYAGFWDAHPITWHTRFGVHVTPVQGCGEGANCRFYQHFIDAWYAPQPGRSFLVIDPSLPTQPNVDARYGSPVAQTQFGSVRVYVYDHDIAGDLGG